MNLTKFSLLVVAIMFLPTDLEVRGATIAWTNTSGGNWSVAANWNPNQVPGLADTAVIAAAGTYTVMFDASATIAGMTVGGTSGTQTFSLSANTLTLNGPATINSNGEFNLSGGTLDGTNGMIAGLLTWTGGAVGDGSLGCSLTVATNGTLVLAGNNGTEYTLFGTLTNAGTVRLVSGNLRLWCHPGYLINLPDALVDITADVSVDPGGCGGELFINQGTVRKSGGTGISNIGPTFNNSRLLEVQTGTVNMNQYNGGTGNGVFEADAGATLEFNGNYTFNGGSQFIGAGTNLFSGGGITFNSVIVSSNAFLAGAKLEGTNGIITGVLTWTSSGSAFDNGGTLTIGTNGVLVLAGITNNNYWMGGVLTNAGTIRLVSGNLNLVCSFRQLYNLPGALIDITADVSIASIDYANELCAGLLVNQGTIRKSGGTGTSVINPIFANFGLLDVESGTVSLSYSFSQTNGTLNVGINNATNFGAVTSSGNATMTGTLSATSINGYVPAISNSFAVLTYGSKTGTFNNLALPALASNEQWQVSYGSSSLILTVLGSTNGSSQITGTVTGSSGGAISNVTVFAYATNAPNSYLSADTDSSGHYALSVANGTWVVAVQSLVAQGYGTVASQTIVVSSANRVVNFVVPCINLQVPANIVVSACTATQIFYSPTATDASCSNVTVVCTPASGTFFAPGTVTNIQCLATDSCGNSNTTSFTVTVLGQDILPIFSTGVDANGVPLPLGSVDEHYSLTQPGVAAAAPAYVVLGNGLPNTAQSQWIAPAPDGSGGNWSAQMTFSVPFASGLVITGQCAADNGVGVYIDSITNNAESVSGTFGSWQPFTITNVSPGQHTLICLVTNYGGPTALKVELAGLTVCPTNCLQVQGLPSTVVSSCLATQLFYTPIVTDACCSNWNVSCDPPSGSFFNPGTATTVLCTASDACGNTNISSFIVTVVCPSAPDIIAEPQSLTVSSNSTANFSVIAIGQSPLGYQWLLDGAPLTDNGRIGGSKTSSLSVPNAQATDDGIYQVVVSNAFGSITSGAATLTVVVPPAITVSPLAQTLGVGGTANFSVEVSGSEPFTYQWLFNTNSSLPGATNATLTLANVQPANQGYYSVMVANGAGSTSSVPVLLTVLSGYFASAQPSQPIYPMGSVVPLTVQTLYSSNSLPNPYQSAVVWISGGGFLRSLPAMTDLSGSTVVDFTPLPDEVGTYSVAAALPGLPMPAAQTSFTLVGMSLSTNILAAQVIPGLAVTNSITLSNLTSVDLTNLSASVIGLTPDVGVLPLVPPMLPGGATGRLTCVMTNRVNTPSQDQFEIQLTTAQGTTNTIFVAAEVVAPVAQLATTPATLNASMLQGGQTLVSFTVANIGAAASGPVEVILPPVPWLAVVTPQPIPPLAPGQSSQVTLALTPGTNLSVGPYSGTLDLSSTGMLLSVPFTFNCISSQIGDLQVTVQDELTYLETNAPNVANATVTVSDFLTGSNIVSAVTDSSGTVLFTNLTVAYYTVSVTATNHGNFSTTFLLSGGQTNTVMAFLPLQLVDYTWVATPTGIPDHYLFTLDATFQTLVPFPVVTINPGAIDLCTLQGATNYVLLSVTNSGLITAQGLSLSFGSHPDWTFIWPAGDLGDLPATNSMVVPVTVIRTGSSTNVAHQIPAGLTWHVTADNGTFVRFVPFFVFDANPMDCIPITCASCPPPPPPGPVLPCINCGCAYCPPPPLCPTCPAPPPPPPPPPPNYTIQTPQGALVHVKIQIDQNAVLARDAFHAALKLDNNSGTTISNLAAAVTVYDASNNIVTNLFGISPPQLIGLPPVDGTGVMTNGESGQVTWTIVPTTNAAPQFPASYSIGGCFSYALNGEPVVVPLFRVPITVMPTPLLAVDYFLERDVYGDDPFTPQVEPSIPFGLGILVRNNGYGTAHDLSITSGQPEITENSNGLVVAFQIISSQVGTNPVSPSLTLDLGDILPGGTAEGLWYMTCSLEGRFTNFSASFKHTDDLGNTNVSLFTSVNTHEMNHVVRLTNPDDGLPDFLVNDTTNVDAMANVVYSSAGPNYAVTSYAITNFSVGGMSNSAVMVTCNNALTNGFVYLEIVDPSGGNAGIVSVQRGDGTSLLIGPNVWQTPARPDMWPPKPYSLVHIFDYNPTTNSYTITYGQLITPPTAITGVATDLTQTNAVLNATVMLNGGDTEAFFQWGTTTNYGNVTANDTLLWSSPNSPQYVAQGIDDLQANTAYHYRVVAANSAGTSYGADGTFVTPTNEPPVICPISNQLAVVGQSLTITNHAHSFNPPLTFTLDPSDPPGTAITTNGLFTWSPSCEQGSSNYLIKIWVTDSATPPLSNSTSFLVTVGDCVQVGIGSAIMKVGDTANVPLTLISSRIALTNLTFTVNFPPSRFTNWSFAVSNNAIQSPLMVTTNPTQNFFALGASSNSPLRGPTLMGSLSFGALAGHSAFVPLVITAVEGTKADGSLVGNAFGQNGRVVIIGVEPLLEAGTSSNSVRLLTLYGNPGTNYRTLYNTNLASTNWWYSRPPLSMTNLFQYVPVDQTSPQIHYRALTQP